MTLEGFIREQPAAVMATLAHTEAALADWRPDAFGAIVLVGSGSSLNANALVAPLLAQAAGRPVQVVGPQAFLRDIELWRIGRPLVVVTTQTGVSRTSVAAAQAAAQAGCPVLIVTAAGDSPVARLELPLVVMPIGAEPIGPKTKGFAATVAALAALGTRLGGPDTAEPDLESALSAAVEAAHAAPSQLGETADTLDYTLDYMLVCGEGALYGAALEASLKVAEIAGLPTAAYTLEEALHGRLHGLTARSLVVLLPGNAEDYRTAAGAACAMARHGVAARVLRATGEGGASGSATDWRIDAPRMTPPWDALAAVMPFQWLALSLARARGLVPEAMRYPGLTGQLDIKLDDQP